MVVTISYNFISQLLKHYKTNDDFLSANTNGGMASEFNCE